MKNLVNLNLISFLALTNLMCFTRKQEPVDKNLFFVKNFLIRLVGWNQDWQKFQNLPSSSFYE